MIEKIKCIKNIAVFNDFEWDNHVIDKNGHVVCLKKHNIIYGRNYSGKTTLSRIVRAVETGFISDKYENPEFSIVFDDGSEITQTGLNAHTKSVRVFNEDFVKRNLKFISNPDESIESFAIFGDDNNTIEKEIEELEGELGSSIEGEETKLYKAKIDSGKELKQANDYVKSKKDNLNSQLSNKAIGRQNGIKYNPAKFGDHNYSRPKLETDIKVVIKSNFTPIPVDEKGRLEELINEQIKTIPIVAPPNLQFVNLIAEVEVLVEKPVGVSDKIDVLVKDAILNKWTMDGLKLHKDKLVNCAFCGTEITPSRWEKLEKHFDEESLKLESDIDRLLITLDKEKQIALNLDANRYYASFRNDIIKVHESYDSLASLYNRSIDELITQLTNRKTSLYTPLTFNLPEDKSDIFLTVFNTVGDIYAKAVLYTTELSSKQQEAKAKLRLREVSDFIQTINYSQLEIDIKNLEVLAEEKRTINTGLDTLITSKEKLIKEKKAEMNDEQKGATKVNELLNNYFGHQFISFEA